MGDVVLAVLIARGVFAVPFRGIVLLYLVLAGLYVFPHISGQVAGMVATEPADRDWLMGIAEIIRSNTFDSYFLPSSFNRGLAAQ